MHSILYYHTYNSLIYIRYKLNILGIVVQVETTIYAIVNKIKNKTLNKI
jgi:hypothetical protein